MRLHCIIPKFVPAQHVCMMCDLMVIARLEVWPARSSWARSCPLALLLQNTSVRMQHGWDGKCVLSPTKLCPENDCKGLAACR